MLLDLLSTTALLAVVALTVPTTVYCIEALAGAVPSKVRRRSAAPPAEKRAGATVAILVPAHDEEEVIGPTLDRIRPQLASGDRLVVVADNCTDRTAELARQSGAEVIERHDDTRRGKGYALDAGIRHLAGAPRDHVMIIDADCDLDDGAINALVAFAAVSGRPVQGRNLMKTPQGSPLDTRLAEFAFLVRNLVRPTGMARLGLPCPLLGTGMVIPWKIIRQGNLAHGHVTEDMKLSIDLAESGHSAVFCPDRGIVSYFPLASEATDTQRRRWEGGHLMMIAAALGRFLKPSTIGNRQVLALLLDCIVPPLTLLFLLLAGATVLTAALAASGGSSLPLLIAATGLTLLCAVTAIVWLLRGRDILPPRAIFAFPVFLFKKARAYAGFASGRPSPGWVRTARGKREAT